MEVDDTKPVAAEFDEGSAGEHPVKSAMKTFDEKVVNPVQYFVLLKYARLQISKRSEKMFDQYKPLIGSCSLPPLLCSLSLVCDRHALH